MHLTRPGQYGPLLIPVWRLDELAGGGGDPGILRVVGDVDLVVRNQEHHLCNVPISRQVTVSVELQNHFLWINNKIQNENHK